MSFHRGSLSDDPFRANREMRRVLHLTFEACSAKRMLIALREEGQLLTVHRAAALVSQFFRERLIAQRGERRGTRQLHLFHVFEYLVRRVVTGRRALKSLLRSWAARRRKEISDCVDEWKKAEVAARAQLSFPQYMVLWVPDSDKRRVAAAYRRKCCHRLMQECRAFIETFQEMSTNFFRTVLRLHAVPWESYRIVKGFIFFLIANCYHKTLLGFYNCNLFTLVVVAAQEKCASVDRNRRLEDFMPMWVARRLHDPSVLSPDPLSECPELSEVTRVPLFPSQYCDLTGPRRATAMFQIPLAVPLSVHSRSPRPLSKTPTPQYNESEAAGGADQWCPFPPTTSPADADCLLSKSGDLPKQGDSLAHAADEMNVLPAIAAGVDVELGRLFPVIPTCMEESPSYGTDIVVLGDGWLEDPRWMGSMEGTGEEPEDTHFSPSQLRGYLRKVASNDAHNFQRQIHALTLQQRIGKKHSSEQRRHQGNRRGSNPNIPPRAPHPPSASPVVAPPRALPIPSELCPLLVSKHRFPAYSEMTDGAAQGLAVPTEVPLLPRRAALHPHRDKFRKEEFPMMKRRRLFGPPTAEDLQTELSALRCPRSTVLRGNRIRSLLQNVQSCESPSK